MGGDLTPSANAPDEPHVGDLALSLGDKIARARAAQEASGRIPDGTDDLAHIAPYVRPRDDLALDVWGPRAEPRREIGFASHIFASCALPYRDPGDLQRTLGANRNPMNAKPSALSRLERGSPAQQAATPASVVVGNETVRVKPVRITVDLEPSDYDTLRDFGHEHRMRHADVVRAAVELLRNDPTMGERLLAAHRSKSATQ